MRKLIGGKLHGIRVTQSNLDYHGSITLDPDHCEAAGILPLEFVEIWNKNSGARISTYVILGERGSRCCIMNGAAARTCQQGDELIICSSIYMSGSIAGHSPAVVTLDADNNIDETLCYTVSLDGDGRYHFAILNEGGARLKIPLRSGSGETGKSNPALADHIFPGPKGAAQP
jgi:aspartate 1-decarboxylase